MNSNQPRMLSRRHFIAGTTLAAGAAWMAPHWLMGAEKEPGGLVQKMRGAAAEAKVVAQPLRGNVTALIGSGGNISVNVGRDGKLLIDAGLAGSQPTIKKLLAAMGDTPLHHVVNTHWHFDHTDGNAWLHESGATLVAHENTLKHLSVPTRVEDWDFTFPPSPAGALPTVLVKKEHLIETNGTKIELGYYGPCHTDGDLWAYFTDADVLSTGDTFWNGHYPFIDYSTGGSINGTIRAVEANLAKATEKTVIVPGHGPVGNRAELTDFRDMLVTIRDAVAKLKKQGKSMDEVVAAKPTAANDKKYGGFVITPDHFAKLAYAGV